ncbi:hypothetical protein LHP98_19345, partial [Rhodobacter sp. Har01]|nr:hypothetical protein [Rhodobacter sp. Har01]
FSVRLRPSSPVFAATTDLYARQRKRELSANLTPAASAEELLRELSTMGFASYEAFAAHAFIEETRARNIQIGRKDERSVGAQVNLISLLEETLAEQAKLTALFAELLILPVNMRL